VTRLSINDLLEQERASLRRMDPVAAFAAQSNGAIIIDTRIQAHRDRDGVVAGSIHMHRTTIEWECDPESGAQHPDIKGFDQLLIVMCHEGYSSSLAAATLQRLGFHRATDMIGGFEAWVEAGLHVVRDSETTTQP
jgi:rhodanese-related sulfurtransferase